MDIYDKAIEHYGREKQCMMTAEECAELIQALSKALRYDGESFIRQVAEEVADVEIMLEQVNQADVWAVSLHGGGVQADKACTARMVHKAGQGVMIWSKE